MSLIKDRSTRLLYEFGLYRGGGELTGVTQYILACFFSNQGFLKAPIDKYRWICSLNYSLTIGKQSVSSKTRINSYKCRTSSVNLGSGTIYIYATPSYQAGFAKEPKFGLLVWNKDYQLNRQLISLILNCTRVDILYEGHIRAALNKKNMEEIHPR